MRGKKKKNNNCASKADGELEEEGPHWDCRQCSVSFWCHILENKIYPFKNYLFST